MLQLPVWKSNCFLEAHGQRLSRQSSSIRLTGEYDMEFLWKISLLIEGEESIDCRHSEDRYRSDNEHLIYSYTESFIVDV